MGGHLEGPDSGLGFDGQTTNSPPRKRMRGDIDSVCTKVTRTCCADNEVQQDDWLI